LNSCFRLVQVVCDDGVLSVDDRLRVSDAANEQKLSGKEKGEKGSPGHV
jgi:hypothetical protein